MIMMKMNENGEVEAERVDATPTKSEPAVKGEIRSIEDWERWNRVWSTDTHVYLKVKDEAVLDKLKDLFQEWMVNMGRNRTESVSFNLTMDILISDRVPLPNEMDYGRGSEFYRLYASTEYRTGPEAKTVIKTSEMYAGKAYNGMDRIGEITAVTEAKLDDRHMRLKFRTSEGKEYVMSHEWEKETRRVRTTYVMSMYNKRLMVTRMYDELEDDFSTVCLRNFTDSQVVNDVLTTMWRRGDFELYDISEIMRIQEIRKENQILLKKMQAQGA